MLRQHHVTILYNFYKNCLICKLTNPPCLVWMVHFLVLSQSHQPRTTLQLHSLVHSPWNSDSPHLPTVIKSPFISSHSALHLSYCCYPNTNYLCYLPVLTRVSSSHCDITALDSRPCLYSPASQLSLHCSSVCLYGLVHTNTFFFSDLAFRSHWDAICVTENWAF